MAFDEQHAQALRNTEQWRQAAFAFELRAMRVEYVLRLLVAAGHVTQEKVDQALELARDFKRADGVAGTDPKT